jgi:hypothetical protein
VPTSLVSGSILETVPSRLFATQTRSSPNAIPVGPLPTGIPPDLVAGRVDPHHRVVFAAGHPDGVGAKRHLVGGVRELDPLGHPAGAGGDAGHQPAVLGPAATHTASGEAARAIGLASTVMGVASVSRAARATCR